MQSKISFFNKTLFRKNLTRFWPLWAMPSFIGALFPLAMLTQILRYGSEWMFGQNADYALEFTAVYYEVVSYGVPIISLCYAVLVAVAVWSYLFNSRSVGLMHTLPLRREGWFLTNFLSGMVMMAIPYVVTGLLCVLISIAFGFFDPVGLLVTVLAVIADSLFYFASATLVAFITGNLFAMPVLYFIFHFLAVGLDALVCTFAQGFLFGLSGTYSGVVEFLSPTVFLVSNVKCDRTYVERFVPGDPLKYGLTPDGYGYYISELTDVALENGWFIAVYALAGVVLLAAAWALYSRRRSESAGDVVSVGWMKPVFRYGVSFCGALLGGLGLYAVFWAQFQYSEYYAVIPLVICMLIAGAISYYIASMLLAKSLRVFRGSWKGVGLMAAGVLVVCAVLQFDLFGVEKRVPAIGEVERVELYAADNSYVFYPGEEDELLEQVRALHTAVVADAEYVKNYHENWRGARPAGDWNDTLTSTYIRLEYYLKDGRVVDRRYTLPLTRARLDQPGTYDCLLDQLVNSETMKYKRLHVNDTRFQPESAYLYVETQGEYGKEYDLNSREAAAILDAVRQDAAAGNWGKYEWFGYDDGNTYAMNLNMEFVYSYQSENGDTRRQYDSIHINLRPEMTHTVQCLLGLGLITREDLVTRAELYPEQYVNNYTVWEEKYGYAYDVSDSRPMTEETAVEIVGGISGLPVSSVGIIGGADGPTAILVN